MEKLLKIIGFLAVAAPVIIWDLVVNAPDYPEYEKLLQWVME